MGIPVPEAFKQSTIEASGWDQALTWPGDALLLPLADAHPMPWGAIRDHLARNGFQLSTDLPPRQFAGGLANLNFLLHVNGQWMVLRRPPFGALPPGANDMRREHRVLAGLWRAVPVAPRSFHLCEDPAIAGAPFQLLEFRSGQAIRGTDLSPLPATPATGRALSAMLVETLASIHSADPVAVGLGDFGRPEGFFRRNAAGWEHRASLVATDGLTTAAREIVAWLKVCPDPGSGEPVLLHNDFKLDNVLVDMASLRPLAVVDWDMASRGDALFDLATLLSYWTEERDPPVMHRLGQMPTAAPGFFTREEAARAYAKATGRPLESIKAYRVLTMLKLGVVFQQLHRLGGENSNAARYADFDQLGAELFEFTLDILHDRIF